MSDGNFSLNINGNTITSCKNLFSGIVQVSFSFSYFEQVNIDWEEFLTVTYMNSFECFLFKDIYYDFITYARKLVAASELK